MDRLFVVNKPPHISSNGYLRRIKRKYNVKKAGYSGTLDPFACGCLIVAFGSYTKLFDHIQKTPKTYRATMWLGATSPSLDLENIVNIKQVAKLHPKEVKQAIEQLQGEQTYTAPKYSAKRINGKRAYDLARDNQEFTLPTLHATVYKAKFINYNHPFVTFEVSVSEGTYVRSLCELVANRLEVPATLSYLNRLNEGKFFYDNEKALDPLEFLKMEQNYYEDIDALTLGKKLELSKFRNQDNGIYYVQLHDAFSIIEIKDEKINYIKNRINRC
ncbi:MAG: tRNA pseudouridine(55) synthase TruB [Campylobacterota bacterium]